jgi:uncharacterized protein YbcI
VRQPDTEHGQITSTISANIVRLHARAYGRGPTKARTFLTPFYAMCVMEDVFTTAERTLIEHGRALDVRDTRMAFQDAMRPQFEQIVEEATGRQVRAFMSQVTTDPEVAVELFIFHPLEEAPAEDG